MDMMMSEVLMRLGWTSLQSAVLVALVWGVCRLLPQLPSATRCRLWWLVAAQAVLGLLWSSPLELAVLPAPAAVTAPAMALPAFDAAVQAAPVTYAATALESATMTASWPLLLLAAWAAGVLLMLMHSLRGYRASRALVRSATECTDAGLQQALQLAAEAHGLRRSPQLKLSAQIRSPQLIGPWRPVLLLPARELPTMSADDLDMALTHELIHLQRRDLWWGLLPALSQHLFFFHPLVHVAAREYALAREEACDGAVVAGHDHCRHDYGRLLVQLGVAPRPAVGVASASPNLRSLKRRLRTLQQTRSVPRVASLAITALFVVIGIAPLRLVAAPPPPAAPQAPVAPTAPTPPAPPAPAPEPPPAPPPVSAPQPPQAPAAPRAPAPPEALADDVSFVTHGKLNITRQPAQAFVLIGGESNFVDASVADLKQARRDAGNDQPALWVRRGQDRYLIRDPAVLKALGHTQTEVAALGTAQAELGNRQAAIGQQIAAASLQITADAMASVDVSAVVNSAIRDAGLDAAVEADRAARQGARQSRAAASAASQAAREARTASARAVDARQIALVAREQAELGKEQARLAQQQSVASARAVRDVRTAIDQALASGKAERVRN
ncbi:M56 family metallopeptidase [Stenotrophomonas sp. TWI809]|jgi:beta-lactamase regulating signal transducer with metallopeptidase domain|uniref:M56 family metallopeptidase n=2 Tax=unclassified Stenotrophomonas TaxID=196198 RepID=UPI00320B53BD